MKTFDEIFKDKINAETQYLIYIDGDEIRWDKEVGKCRSCDNQTHFYSINFMSRYCSIHCVNEEWKRYHETRVEV